MDNKKVDKDAEKDILPNNPLLLKKPTHNLKYAPRKPRQCKVICRPREEIEEIEKIEKLNK